MIPIDQTKFGHTQKDAGDCFSACIASILELSLEDVPVFCGICGDWWGAYIDWLEKRGLTSQCYEYNEDYPPRMLHTATGKSPRGKWNHCVVWFNGKMVHDPHPSREGLDGLPETYDVITPIDISKWRKI